MALPENLSIPFATPELIVDAIKTLPVDIQRGRLTFSAAGLVWPGEDGINNREEYLKRCAAAGVIPFSTVAHTYQQTEGRFRYENGISIAENWKLGTKGLETIDDLLLSGAKPHLLNFDLDELAFNLKGGFAHLKDVRLDHLTAKGYTPYRGKLLLAIRPPRPYNFESLSQRDASLAVYAGRSNTLGLNFPFVEVRADYSGISTWFQTLAQRHGLAVVTQEAMIAAENRSTRP